MKKAILGLAAVVLLAASPASATVGPDGEKPSPGTCVKVTSGQTSCESKLVWGLKKVKLGDQVFYYWTWVVDTRERI